LLKVKVMKLKISAVTVLLAFCGLLVHAQQNNAAATQWVNSEFKKLSNEEKIAQLMVVRLSAIDSKTKVVTFYDEQVKQLVKKYNVGGICVFQGSPVKQANILNSLQQQAKTPIMVCIDGEWGVGMRIIDSVQSLPKQMMLGAMKDATVVYKYGQLVAQQCKRMGIQVNYAPVVDVNNNPNNPVINDRSFGENKYKVASYGIEYTKGMQDAGVMGCAKHFPGHGDVTADSHYDLPVINKSRAELDSLELYPFKQIFNAGVGSVMIAHLYIPSIDKTANRATSLSPANINGILRTELKYDGLTFTDALEMQGVKKFFPDGEAAVQSLIAGNDMLCLPGDVTITINKIKQAIKKKRLSWADIDKHCKKVLYAKYQYGLNNKPVISIENLAADLNAGIPEMTKLVAENAITLVNKADTGFFPLMEATPNRIAYVGFGISAENEFARQLKTKFNAAVFYGNEPSLMQKLSSYKKVIIGFHNMGRFASNNFGLTEATLSAYNQIQQKFKTITFVFGNPYSLKNMCSIKNVVVAYQDDAIVQKVAADMLAGTLPYKGELPVTVCDNLKYGHGLASETLSDVFKKKTLIESIFLASLRKLTP
jgi:beta-N-acetylhexosaminidase